jgi:hypothetical protein
MRRLTQEQFIEKAKLIHGDKYDYSKVIYLTSESYVDIICPKHGIFKQTPHAHIHIKNRCKYINVLPFDFYLPKYNICIEYDGEQHFEPLEFFGGIKAFDELKKRDEIKTKFCRDNNIKLIRISYRDSIKKYLEKIL